MFHLNVGGILEPGTELLKGLPGTAVSAVKTLHRALGNHGAELRLEATRETGQCRTLVLGEGTVLASDGAANNTGDANCSK